MWIKSLGDWSDSGTPGNISNPVVKAVSADGTWGATPWESRSLPRDFFLLYRCKWSSWFFELGILALNSWNYDNPCSLDVYPIERVFTDQAYKWINPIVSKMQKMRYNVICLLRASVTKSMKWRGDWKKSGSPKVFLDGSKPQPRSYAVILFPSRREVRNQWLLLF